MIKQASKVENIPFSPIRKIFDYANILKSQGKDVINLGIGEPDFDTPSHINEAMFEATKRVQHTTLLIKELSNLDKQFVINCWKITSYYIILKK